MHVAMKYVIIGSDNGFIWAKDIFVNWILRNKPLILADDWWRKRQGISKNNIDLILPEWSGFSSRKVDVLRADVSTF